MVSELKKVKGAGHVSHSNLLFEPQSENLSPCQELGVFPCRGHRNIKPQAWKELKEKK